MNSIGNLNTIFTSHVSHVQYSFRRCSFKLQFKSSSVTKCKWSLISAIKFMVCSAIKVYHKMSFMVRILVPFIRWNKMNGNCYLVENIFINFSYKYNSVCNYFCFFLLNKYCNVCLFAFHYFSPRKMDMFWLGVLYLRFFVRFIHEMLLNNKKKMCLLPFN